MSCMRRRDEILDMSMVDRYLECLECFKIDWGLSNKKLSHVPEYVLRAERIYMLDDGFRVKLRESIKDIIIHDVMTLV